LKRIKILTLILALAMLIAPILVLRPVSLVQAQPTPGAPVYFSVEPVANPPLTDLNASANGLQTPTTPLPGTPPIGQNFTVQIHLRNATTVNAPNGIISAEVHFYFGNILNYAMPIAFQDLLGQGAGDALVGPVIETITGGLYNSTGGLCGPSQYPGEEPSSPGYSGPVEYDVSAATITDANWTGADGLVATITFEITGQPSTLLGQLDFKAPLYITYADLYTTLYEPWGQWVSVEQPFSIVQGTLQIGVAAGIHDVTVADPPAKTVVGQGNGFNVTVTLTNLGNYTEIFCRAAVYLKTFFGGGSPIITLAAGGSANVTFTVSSTNVPYGNRTLNVYAPSFGEPNHNNNGTCGSVIITISGDCNGDYQVKLPDLSILAKAYGTTPASPKWVANADINNNGKVDLPDLSVLAKNYNKVVTPSP